MALTKDQKAKLIEVYQGKIDQASNVVLLEQKGVPVNEVNEIRKLMSSTGWQMLIAKKRLFLQSSWKVGCEDSNLLKIWWNLTVLFAWEDEFAPLKAIYKVNKEFAKKKASYGYKYLGWWYWKIWKDAQYVEEMASLPSKEELVGKFLFLLKYPVQSFVAVLDQIKEKADAGTIVSAPVEKPVELKEEATAPVESTEEVVQEEAAE